jgi:alpha/beta superfamily hydrolase
MKQEVVTFPCEQIILHGYCFTPDKTGELPGVVICHPHSLYGGSMDNIIITGLAAALTDKGIISLIFNFRGVGKSQGNFGDGIAEQDDVISALDWLTAQPQIDKDRVGLAGYSFGGGVCIPVACTDNRVKTLALISPVITEDSIEKLSHCHKSKMFIVGEYDDVIPPEIVEVAYKKATEPKQYKLINGADHFWGSHADKAIITAADFLSKTLIS